VVDGHIAFTGGVNISQAYSSGSLFRSKSRAAQAPGGDGTVGWRDTHLQLQGPAVAALQTLFLKTWNAHAEPPVADAGLFPPLPVVGNKTVRVIASEPGGQREVHTAYLDAIRAAKQRIYLTCAYFVPDAPMLEALLDAARRNVDVRLVVPGVSEGGMVFYASHSFFDGMLQSGMRIFQMRQAVLHAKTAVIDGQWSTVGSTNMDTRSFFHNSEINLIVIDRAFGADMEAAFAEDLSDSDEVLLPSWRRRPWADRIKEWTARQFDYWL
jgi:cardiolipin synthase